MGSSSTAADPLGTSPLRMTSLGRTRPEEGRSGRPWPDSLTGRRQELLRLFREGRETGRINFASVSGILTTRPEMIREVDHRLEPIIVITSKSYQVQPNPGNREPVIVETAPGNFGNAVGLKNPGLKRGLEELSSLRKGYPMRALLNVSVSGSTPEEFARLAEAFSSVADILELNFSCPHAAPGYGMSIGVDPKLVALYVKTIRHATDLPILPKLTPNVPSIAEVAQAAVESGADGLVAINTVGPELYIEPHSGSPILMNNHGGRGGKSGIWIRELALQKVAEIRSAVGGDIPLIGMGGIFDRSSAERMIEAGADIIGIGSAFALHRPAAWKSWFEGMAFPDGGPDSGSNSETRPKAEAGEEHEKKSTREVPAPLTKRQMEYRPFTIRKSEEGAGGLRRITLEGSMEYEAGQFAFLWIPGVGEKPFSVALSDPLAFLVRERGSMTRALCKLQAGDTLYLRGVYGQGATLHPSAPAWILAGGTGLAVVPKLAKGLHDAGCKVTVIMGLADDPEDSKKRNNPDGEALRAEAGRGDLAEVKAGGAAEAGLWTSHDEALLIQEISRYADYRIVQDRGEVGRAIRVFSEELLRRGGAGETSLYTIGPFPFMHAAAEAARQRGIDLERIQISIETPTRCGVGLCGECACVGRLTCREGTFFSLKELDKRGITLLECGDDH